MISDAALALILGDIFLLILLFKLNRKYYIGESEDEEIEKK